MIESGLVYIHYANHPTAFAGCGALVEGPFIVTCRHVWDEAVKATGDSSNVHIRFRPPGGEGEAKINPATLVDPCNNLGKPPDLVILAADIPDGATAYGLARAKPQPTRGYAIAGLQRNGPGTAVYGVTIWGELAGYIDEGLRQFTGEKSKAFFTDRGSSGSPLLIESTDELAGIVSLSEIGDSPGAARIQEAFAVPATIIHRHLSHYVGHDTARACGVDEAKIPQILDTIGASEITIAELRRRLGLYFQNLQAHPPAPVPANHGADIDSAIAKSRRLSAAFQPADALAVLDATIAEETAARLQRLAPLLEEKVRQQRLTYDYEGVKASLRELLALDPGRTGWLHDLSVTHEKIGDVQLTQGNLTAARDSYQAALSLRERLVKTEPDNTGWRREISVTHAKIGDVQFAQGDLAAARNGYQAALIIRKRLVKTDPSNTEWERDLSISHDRIGDVQRAQSDFAAALKSYQAALTISERLVRTHPDNAVWQRDLAISHHKIGDVQVDQADLTAALNSYQAALTTAVSLAKTDPGNAEWQRDLSVSHDRFGNVQFSRGDLTAALDNYQAALTSRERLANTDPSNAEWQRDVAVSLGNVAMVEAHQGLRPEALARFRKARDIIAQLRQKSPDNATLPKDLAWFESQITALEQPPGP